MYILLHVNLNLLIAMQNLCEDSISHEKSKDLNFILRF